MTSHQQTIAPLAEVVDPRTHSRAARQAKAKAVKAVQSSLPAPGRGSSRVSAKYHGGASSRPVRLLPAADTTRDLTHTVCNSCVGGGGVQASNGFFATEVDFGQDDASLPKLGSGSKPSSPAAVTRKRLAKVDEARLEYDASGPTDLPASVPLAVVMENTITTLGVRSKKKLRHWRKLFNSGPSQAVIKDTFWWMHAHLCVNKGRPTSPTADMERVFDRIASNFANLLLTVPRQFNDTFMGKYHDALAQVVFNGFWFGFPGSRKLFTEEFRQQLLNTCGEWTQGLRPSVPKHDHWHVGDTSVKATNARTRRARQTGLGPTMFEERAMATGTTVGDGVGAGGGAGPPGSRVTTAPNNNRTRRLLGRDTTQRVQRQSMFLYKPIIRERVTYELSHSGLLKRYLTRTRDEHTAAAEALAASRPPTHSGTRRRRRRPAHLQARPRTTGSRHSRGGRLGSTGASTLRPTLQPPVSPFSARVTLTEDVGTPLIGFGGKRRARRVRTAPSPTLAPGTPTTFLELVDKSQATREIVKDEYQCGKVLAHHEIRVAKTMAEQEQRGLRQRRDAAMGGDVHEFSNYLVSMWALAEEKNKKKGSRKAT